MTVGGGTDPSASLGPLMSERGVQKVESHIKQAQSLGAKIEWQAPSDYLKKEFSSGYFYPPTILTGLTPKMDIWTEETFGPLAAIAVFDTEEEALALANDSTVGLGAYLFTNNLSRAWRVAEEIETGMVRRHRFLVLNSVLTISRRMYRSLSITVCSVPQRLPSAA